MDPASVLALLRSAAVPALATTFPAATAAPVTQQHTNSNIALDAAALESKDLRRENGRLANSLSQSKADNRKIGAQLKVCEGGIAKQGVLGEKVQGSGAPPVH